MMDHAAIIRHLRYTLDVLEVDGEEETAIKALELGARLLRKLQGVTTLEYYFQDAVGRMPPT